MAECHETIADEAEMKKYEVGEIVVFKTIFGVNSPNKENEGIWYVMQPLEKDAVSLSRAKNGDGSLSLLLPGYVSGSRRWMTT